MRPRRRAASRAYAAAVALLVAVLCGLVGSVIAQAMNGQGQGQKARAAAGPRGAIGPRGALGPPGPAGPLGPVGPGADDVRHQAVTVNWQNGRYQNRDTAAFTAPGIGTGEVVCRPDTQWLRFFPSNANADTAMTWLESEPGNRVGVNTALRTQYTGADFYAGFNDYLGQQSSVGSLQGIISSRLDRTLNGGPGPAPTTFRVTWHWAFGDGAPRCYVAGEFVSTGAAQ